jgi:hypothetical protein
MNLGLDYDKTYSVDPGFWDTVVELALLAGHDVRIVTIRDERYDRTAPLIELEKRLPIIWTRGTAKRWFITHFVPDFPVDVWVDDRPETILYNSATTPEDLAAWRAGRGEASA